MPYLKQEGMQGSRGGETHEIVTLPLQLIFCAFLLWMYKVLACHNPMPAAEHLCSTKYWQCTRSFSVLQANLKTSALQLRSMTRGESLLKWRMRLWSEVGDSDMDGQRLLLRHTLGLKPTDSVNYTKHIFILLSWQPNHKIQFNLHTPRGLFLFHVRKTHFTPHSYAEGRLDSRDTASTMHITCRSSSEGSIPQIFTRLFHPVQSCDAGNENCTIVESFQCM
jgi:hypothetical protein